MKICSIIAEFNPFHNGHKRILEFAKANAEEVVVIMSGNFTQRGLPACSDKYTRARHAITFGADAVLELPTLYATSSAQNFAQGAIEIAQAINTELLCFGSESGDVQLLTECAKATLTKEFNDRLKENLKMGISYPKSVAMTLPRYKDILDKPNNTLALEYIKSILLNNSNIKPITLQRPNNYNLNCEIDGFASATALRTMDKTKAYNFAPQQCVDDMSSNAENNYKKYSAIALSTFDLNYLRQVEGISEGLENKFYNANATMEYDSIISQVKSKRYTQLKLQRILLNAVLGITNEVATLRKKTTAPLKLLAVSQSHTALISHLCKLCQNYNEQQKQIINIDLKADKLYTALSGIQQNKSFIKV